MATDLDQRAAGGAELRVYWLEHANAETLLPTLQQLVGGGSDPAQKAGLPPATSSSADGQAAPTPTPAPASTPASTSGGGGSIATRGPAIVTRRSDEHTSELQSLMRISYAVFRLTQKHILTSKRPH